jgi:hypothetical protein
MGWLGGRLLTGGRLLPLDDAVGFVMVLAVASWGFGSAYEWWEARRRRQIPWTTPLAVSLLLGFTLA